jgi:subtilase family serine protease
LIFLLSGICFGADLKELPGHVPKIVASLAPKGRLAATNQLRLAIGLPLRDPAGLDNFVAQVSDPASPNFRRFLTREELTARFGPTEQDYEAVKNFAKTNGLSIEVTHANRLLLDVIGPAAAVEKAFHITLRTYPHPTEARDFFAPDTEPAVNAALPVVDIQGLSDFSRPHPKFVRKRGKNRAEGAPKNGTAPDGSGELFGNDFRNAYVPGVTLTGAGQSVGLVEFDGYYANDILNYANEAGNGRTNIVIQTILLDNYNGRPSSKSIDGGEVEVELDIEMAMSIAPGLAKIVSFEAGESGNQNDILNAMLANSNVLNLSCSWGWGGPSTTTDAIFKSIDAVGQTFFNASGDNGAFTPGSTSVNGVDNPSADNAPSSNPYITQVGGTTMTMNGAGASWASEVVWNWGDDTSSSGGISSYYTIPTWQTNVSNMAGRGGSTGFRDIPDVAANADNVYELYGDGKSTDGIGGTSCAAPMWAGFMALVNQQVAANGGSNSGFINPTLYALAAGSNYASCLHDVTSGNNTWSSSPDLFYATNNYDLCTGLGTMNGQTLINALAHTSTLVSTLISNLTASQSITYGTTAISVAGKISGTGLIYPAQRETVTITIDGKAQTTTIDDSTGDFSFSYNPSTIPASGIAYTIAYSYAGDASLIPATNTSTTLTVNPAALTIKAGAQTKPYGQTVAFGGGSTNFISSGLSNGQTIGTVTLAVSGNGGAATAAVGTYTITPSTATGGSGTESNYSIIYITNTFTITNPFTPFSITSSSLDSTGTNLVICWQSVPGAVYVVMTNSSLGALHSWTPTGSPITATATNTCFTLPGGIVGDTNTFVIIQEQ